MATTTRTSAKPAAMARWTTRPLRRCCQRGYSNCCFESGGGEVKPGSCPYSVWDAISSSYCRSDCTSDTDCYGTQKCCSQGCSRTCRYPDTGSGSGYEKPGSCPYYGSRGGRSYPSYPYYSGSGSTIGGSYCRRDCYQDSECPGSQKCCEINCSSTCVAPQRYY
ncbi:WAP four-disulfide core domain protein 2-like [Pollicipes pollicipes]|uniref:WAP four-disulfide core domain protein 2-like n=1 Tax=Pollicipes pollicipes TaxID=41117 RepID=UPI0018852D60|nr:WAP four-disulfide core domain protein 2-like [Pollicipes pollicipes]